MADDSRDRARGEPNAGGLLQTVPQLRRDLEATDTDPPDLTATELETARPEAGEPEPSVPETAETFEGLGASRNFSLVTAIEVDDPRIQGLLGDTLRPSDGRMVSHGCFAQGGMGTIERIADRTLMRTVAMKVLRQEHRSNEVAVRAFVREAQITGQLDHPNIVPVHDLASTPDGRLCFIMKLVRGRTLSDCIRSLPPGRLSHDRLLDLLDVVLRVCDALAFAHSRGVVHCDVKPGNVMVGQHGQVHLMDWGIAQLVCVTPPPALAQVCCSIDLPDGTASQGTPAYLSPEQATGRGVDQRTDVFAVGALLFAILCRRPPIDAPSRREALRLARLGESPAPAALADGVPPELDRIVVRAMAAEPRDRYPSIGALRRDLVRFIRGGLDFPRVEFEAGAVIVSEGEAGDAAYIIERGRCEVLKMIEGRQRKLREMGPGEVFGEMAILAASRRTATVIALEHTVAFEVNRAALEQEVGAMKSWMSAFIRALAARFQERETDA